MGNSRVTKGISKLEIELKQLIEKLNWIESKIMSYGVNSPDFMTWVDDRNSMLYKISAVNKKIELIKVTGKRNGDFIEAKLPD